MNEGPVGFAAKTKTRGWRAEGRHWGASLFSYSTVGPDWLKTGYELFIWESGDYESDFRIGRPVESARDCLNSDPARRSCDDEMDPARWSCADEMMIPPSKGRPTSRRA